MSDKEPRGDDATDIINDVGNVSGGDGADASSPRSSSDREAVAGKSRPGLSGSAATEHPDRMYNRFEYHFETVNVSEGGDALFGPGADERRGSERQTLAAGRFSPDELIELDRTYVVRPIDGDLVEHVRSRQLTLLCGAAGSGRRTAAVHALKHIDGVATIVELDASHGVSRLFGAQFTAGTAYLVDAGTVGIGDCTSSSLKAVAARLEDTAAFMVVTAPDDAHADRTHQRYLFDWTAPPTGDVFNALMADLDDPPTFRDELVKRALGDHPTVDAAAGLAHRLRRGRRSGRRDDEILRDEPESHRGEIRAWFDAARTLDDLAVMATLCCLGGTDEARFGREQEDLTARLRSRVPARENDAEAALVETRLTRSRSLQLRGCCGEITTRDVTVDGRVARVAVADFVTPSHTAVYLQEFWQASSPTVQDETIGWLADLGCRADRTLRKRLAQVVRDLAAVNLLVVRERLLDVWASEWSQAANLTAAAAIERLAGESGFEDHAIAALTDWSMSDWAPLNFSAMTAFAGTCGMRHPDLATERLAAILRRRPDWTDSASVVWSELTKAVAADDRASAMLVTSAMQLKCVQRVDVSDPSFALVDAWFARGDAVDAALLADLVTGPRSRAAAARLVGRVWAKSNDRIDMWFEALVHTLGSENDVTRNGAAHILLGALEACSDARRGRLLELMNGRLDRWAHTWRKTPDRARAVHRARLTITHGQQKERELAHV
jgi:hypothetical protein